MKKLENDEMIALSILDLSTVPKRMFLKGRGIPLTQNDVSSYIQIAKPLVKSHITLTVWCVTVYFKSIETVYFSTEVENLLPITGHLTVMRPLVGQRRCQFGQGKGNLSFYGKHNTFRPVVLKLFEGEGHMESLERGRGPQGRISGLEKGQ
ncbi:hypothetical protein HOLleu_42279 [Holothuria leucospilota]|uniref:Uncharacterized protein n=1 Tax=Holothuria leucospilota TaxID=206669 RepID=A0A9Q1B9D1_HOLLE|nr:hypothetical protein HOLleu_42279 [Holothuria leucospilota]